MKVTVKLFGEFRGVAGVDLVEIELPMEGTCGDALRGVTEHEPALEALLFANGVLREHLHVFVNGRNVVHLQGLATPLASGDTVTFFPPISGG